MVADESAFDAGTAYLAIEGKLDDKIYANLAKDVAAMPPLPVSLKADVAGFFDDLEKQWQQRSKNFQLPNPVGGSGSGGFGSPSQSDLDSFQKDLLSRLSKFQQQSALKIPLTVDGEQLRTDIAAAVKSLSRQISKAIPDDLAEAAKWRSGVQATVDDTLKKFRLRLPGGKDLPIPVKADLDYFQKDLQSKLTNFEKSSALKIPLTADGEKFRASLNSAIKELGNKIELPMPANQQLAASWRNVLKNELASLTGPEQAVLKQATSPVQNLIQNLNGKTLVEDLKKSYDWMEKIVDKAKMLGLVAGIGGAGLGALGVLGILGGTAGLASHGLMDAFQAQRAVTEEQRDPRAQQQRLMDQKQATQALTDANHGLEESHWRVQSATLAEKLSVMDLADAYKDQTRAVRDASDALTDARLRQEGSALSVARARQRLMQVNMDPTATALDREEAVFGVQEATQSYKESKKKTADQAVDTAITQSRGVEGSKVILQAQQAFVDAQHGTQEALWGVQAATQHVAEAAWNMQKAMTPETVNKLQVALSRLTPEARGFFDQVHALTPEFKNLSNTVSASVFGSGPTSLGASLSQLINDRMPMLKQAFGGVGSALNQSLRGTFSGLDTLLGQMQSNGSAQKAVQGIAEALKGLSPLINGFVAGFGSLIAKVGPGLGQLATIIGNALQSPAIGDFAKSFVDGLVQIAPTLMQLLGDLLKALTPLMPQLAPLLVALGKDLINALQGLVKSGALPTILDALTQMLTVLGPLIEPLARILGFLIKWGEVLPTTETLIRNVANVLRPLGEKILPPLKDAAHDVHEGFKSLADIFRDVFGWVGKLADKIGDLTSSFKGLTSLPGDVGHFFGSLLHFEDGGEVPNRKRGSKSSGTDTQPAMLTPGEYVIQQKSAQQLGSKNLDHMNQTGTLPPDTGGKGGGFTPSTGQPGDLAALGTGGPVNALQYAKSHGPSVPYVWGGAGAAGADCSGWVGDLQLIAEGKTPDHRLGTTMNILDGTWPGFVRGVGPNDAFIIGASDEHMVASILGYNVEERQSGEMARFGDAAASPRSSQFTMLGHIDPSRFSPAYVPAGKSLGSGGGSGKGGFSAGIPGTSAGAPGAGPGVNSGTGDATTNVDNSTDALANQQLFPTGQIPTTFSGLASQGITRLATMAWTGGGPKMPDPTTGSGDVQYQGIQGGLQSAFQGLAGAAPPGAGRDYLNRLFFGPGEIGAAPGSTGATSGFDAGTDKLASQGGGGLINTFGKIFSGAASVLGTAVAGQITSAESVVGMSDSLPGWLTGGIELGNLLMQPQVKLPDTGDPSTTQPQVQSGGAPSKQAGQVPTPGTQPAAPQAATPAPAATMTDAYASQFGASPSLIAIVKGQAKTYGWDTGAEWDAWDQLIGHESSWNPSAQNPGSTAFGMGQFLDNTWSGVGGTKTSDPALQARYMGQYIKNRYGDPITAWNFWQAQDPHWYSDGGDVYGDGSGLSDDVPAWLSNGEFVVNAQSGDRWRPLLKMINNPAVKPPSGPHIDYKRVASQASGNRVTHDHSMTVHISPQDTADALRQLRTLEEQRRQKAAAYQGAMRGAR